MYTDIYISFFEYSVINEIELSLSLKMRLN